VLVLVDSSGSRRCIGRRSALDAAFEDAFDVATVRRALTGDRESALTRSIHGCSAVLLGDANQAKYRTEAHFRLRIPGHRATSDLCHVRPELTGPLGHPLR
jgi:hypothetical protein